VARDTLSWEGLHFYTDRLCLRTPTPRDADPPYDLFTDSEVMQEAAAAIREWAHECRPIKRLVSLISPDNVRPQRVAERLRAIPTETVTPVVEHRTPA